MDWLGIDSDVEVVAELRNLGRRGWVFIDESLDKETAIAETLAAMDGGLVVIVSPILAGAVACRVSHLLLPFSDRPPEALRSREV